MNKIVIFCFALFLFLNFPSVSSKGPRQLQGSTGYGGGSSGGSSNSSSGGGSNSGYGGTTPYYEEEYEEEEREEEYEEEYEEVYEEEYEEKYEEQYEEKYEEQYENNNYGGYGSETPSYEEEYEQNTTYYGGYGSTPPPTEEYETPSYGYGGNPTYNNAANDTYTSDYEEAYAGGSGNEEGETGGEPSVPFVPTSLLTGFVVDIHFLAGDPRFQYIAYHYCSDLYPGYTQCNIYNGTESNSRLVATEIVVSAEIFAQLPMQERKYWHSHAFAVKSGLLVSPNTPADQDLAVMSSVMNSYGKVTDFWHSYQSFPYGGAKLAYGLAEESQINETIAQQLDRDLGLSTTWKERAEQRKSLNPTILPGADEYLTTGEYPQYITQMFPVISETGSTGGSGAGTGSGGGEEELGSGSGEDTEGSTGESGEGDFGGGSGSNDEENGGGNTEENSEGGSNDQENDVSNSGESNEEGSGDGSGGSSGGNGRNASRGSST